MGKNILIAYFSHGGENLIDDAIVDLKGQGITKKVAETLKEELAEKGIKATLFQIEPLVPYDVSYDATLARSKQEYEDGATPLIGSGPTAFEAYEVVFLGYPNWWGTIPGPILSFLRDHDLTGKTLIPFVTHGGQRFLYSLESIRKECPSANLVQGFAIAAPYVDQASPAIREYLQKNSEVLG